MSMATVHKRPTRRQVEVMRAYIGAGSSAGAAHQLSIAESTARQHLSGLYRVTTCRNAVQAAYWLGAQSSGTQPLLDPGHHAAALRVNPPTTAA